MMVVSRRQFFTQFGRTLVGRVLPRSAPASPADKPAAVGCEWLRPPGALPEGRFLKTCTSCTDCRDACSHDSIRRLGSEFQAAAGTPAIIPDESPCYLCNDMPCVAACDTGALVPVARHEVAMGMAVLNRASCYLAMGQPCNYCVARCPLKGVAITFGDGGLPEINEEGCTGCGVCAYLCPGDAIVIVTAVDAADAEVTVAAVDEAAADDIMNRVSGSRAE